MNAYTKVVEKFEYLNYFGLTHSPFEKENNNLDWFFSAELEHKVNLVNYLALHGHYIINLIGEAQSGKSCIAKHLHKQFSIHHISLLLDAEEIKTTQKFSSVLESQVGKHIRLIKEFNKTHSPRDLVIILLDNADELPLLVFTNLLAFIKEANCKNQVLSLVCFSKIALKTRFTLSKAHSEFSYYDIEMPYMDLPDTHKFLRHLLHNENSDIVLPDSLVAEIHNKTNGIIGRIIVQTPGILESYYKYIRRPFGKYLRVKKLIKKYLIICGVIFLCFGGVLGYYLFKQYTFEENQSFTNKMVAPQNFNKEVLQEEIKKIHNSVLNYYN